VYQQNIAALTETIRFYLSPVLEEGLRPGGRQPRLILGVALKQRARQMRRARSGMRAMTFGKSGQRVVGNRAAQAGGHLVKKPKEPSVRSAVPPKARSNPKPPGMGVKTPMRRIVHEIPALRSPRTSVVR